jgi:hypothetical protein
VDDDSGDSIVDGGPPPTTPDRAGETAPHSSIHAPQRNVAVVVALGVLITVGLSFGAYSLHDSNENRLLKQRVREAGVVLGASIPALQTPLASAAVLAESTGGNPTAFRRLMSPTILTRRIKPTPIAASLRCRCGRRTARFADRSRWSAVNRS